MSHHILLDSNGNHDQAVAVGCMYSPCRRWQYLSLVKIFHQFLCRGHKRLQNTLSVVVPQGSLGTSILLIAWQVHAPPCSIMMKRHYQIAVNSLSLSRIASLCTMEVDMQVLPWCRLSSWKTCIDVSFWILELVLPTPCPKHCTDSQVWRRFCCSHEIKQATWPYIQTMWSPCSET